MCDSSVKFLRARFVIFRCQKICKKGYIEMTKKKLPLDFKKCPGSLYFTLLMETVINLQRQMTLMVPKYCKETINVKIKKVAFKNLLSNS